MTTKTRADQHTSRREIARYLLGRGLDPATMAPDAALLDVAARTQPAIGFPAGLEPVMTPVDPAHEPDSPLPRADVVVITWTVDELAGMAKVFCPGHSAAKWARYAHNFDTFAPQIRPHAPAATSKRLGSYQPVTVGGLKVLCMKSELHLNQDGIGTGDGTATLPVKDFFQQIIAETKPKSCSRSARPAACSTTSGSATWSSRGPRSSGCSRSSATSPSTARPITSDWQIPTDQLDTAAER